MTIPGKRSLVIPLKRGRSKAKNLAKLTSLMALNIKIDSFSLGSFLLRLPAAVMTDLTALMP